jgi:UDP-glucose 6-dehydrogenase
MKKSKPIIGFIGQGYIGKNYADDFENRGFTIVRYGKEEPYVKNKGKIKECDIVFIAVPTPTIPDGTNENGSPTFDASILKEVVRLVSKGRIAVIKSTITLGTTKEIQDENPDIFVFHSPEFLTEATAAQDAAHPRRNIVGMARLSTDYEEKARWILSLLPKASFESICDSNEAELIKYGGNNWFYFKIMFINMLYDLAMQTGSNWEVIREAMSEDPRIGYSHLTPVHKSGTLGGDSYKLNPELSDSGERGAGGHCFIKDYAAFVEMYKKHVGDDAGLNALQALEKKNIELLVSSGKDIDLLRGVYGKDVIQ